ncbi:unnamed protein product [Caenorhabditis brenneri]
MNKANIIRCSIFFMFILVCTAEKQEPDNNFGSRERREVKKLVPKRLTDDENELRLEKCGKTDKRSKLDNPWFGTYGKRSELWHKYGMVLISEYHAIVSKSFADFKECTERTRIQTIKEDRYLHFSKTGEPKGNYTTVKIKQVTLIGPCEIGEKALDAIKIVELEKKVDLPYACVSFDETYPVTPSDKLIFPTSYRGNKLGPYHEKQKGTLTTESGSFVWEPMDKNIIPPETNSEWMSMPLLTEGERTTVVALIDSYDKDKKNFKVTHLHPYVRWVCESFNICPRTDKPATTTTTTTKATTTTETTTTTTTTESPTTTTTYYVPEILGDPEMMDFEMPFEGPLVKRWGSGAQSLNLFVVISSGRLLAFEQSDLWRTSGEEMGKWSTKSDFFCVHFSGTTEQVHGMNTCLDTPP